MRTLTLSYTSSTGELKITNDVRGSTMDNNAVTITVTGLPETYLSAKICYGVLVRETGIGSYYPFSELTNGSCTIPAKVCAAASCGRLQIGLKITYADQTIEASVNTVAILMGAYPDPEESVVSALGNQVMMRGSSWDWLSGWTYDTGAVVIHDGVVWRSLTDGNVGHTPQEGSDYWAYISPIDVDDEVSTSSTNPVENQAITNYVNSLVATATGNFLGNLTLTDLGLTYPATNTQIAEALDSYAFSPEPTINDYTVITINNPGTTTADEYRRFKYDGTGWVYEFTIDVNAFTPDQWDAINSGIYNTGAGTLDVQDVRDHIASTANPHSVTKAQVGLGNCDNTSDEDKPVSTAQASAIGLVQGYLDAHEANLNNPHQVTKAQVGLGNVDNYGSVSAWQGTPDDSHIPTEKLVKDSLDAKIDDTQLVTSWQATPDNTHIPSERLVADSLTDGSVTKVGTANVGSDTKPIKLVGGVPTVVTNDLVDVSSAQTIPGAKTFTDKITILNNAPHLLLKSNIALGTNQYLGFIQEVDTNNTEIFDIYPTTNGNGEVGLNIAIKDNGALKIPVRTYDANNTNEVVTIGSLQSSSDVVHTTGNETVAGQKTFTSLTPVMSRSYLFQRVTAENKWFKVFTVNNSSRNIMTLDVIWGHQTYNGYGIGKAVLAAIGGSTIAKWLYRAGNVSAFTADTIFVGVDTTNGKIDVWVKGGYYVYCEISRAIRGNVETGPLTISVSYDGIGVTTIDTTQYDNYAYGTE